ncbi:MAG: HAMP domain-containing protein [Methylococcales bacterium]|nr:HAMP domain-containing protein [Methylococcales bacterium]
MKQRYISFKSKLRLAILLVSFISLTSALLVIGIFNFNKHRGSLFENTKILAKSISYNLSASLVFNDPVTAQQILKSLNATTDIQVAILYNETEEIFAQYHSTLAPSPLPNYAFKKQGYFFTHYLNQEYLDYFHPIISNDKQIGTLFIESNLRQASKYFQSYLSLSLIIIIVAFPIILLLTEILQIIITRPLLALNKSIHDIREQADYSSRVKKISEDEIGDLITSFNQMLTVLESRDQQLKHYQSDLEQQIKQRTQDLLIAKEAAEKANQAKSEFLSNMSHELRTPLNAILGFSQLMDMDELSPSHKDSNDAILTAGQHLLTLITEILELSKIESGYIDLDYQPCSLTTILTSCLDLVKPLVDKRNIVINDEISIKNDCALVTDPTRLKQVIINILSNAIKYNCPSGHITLSSESVDNTLTIKISDTGKGLTEEQISQIFQPFERLGAANSTIEGTGVGLTICKKIMAALNGEIGVYSTLGKGSTFWIKFPIK